MKLARSVTNPLCELEPARESKVGAMKSLLTPDPKVPFVCPRCKGALATEPSYYRCRCCGNSYPVLFGIPDFRARSDRYLSLEEERDKARRLFEFGEHASFRELVQYYYSITSDLPDSM